MKALKDTVTRRYLMVGEFNGMKWIVRVCKGNMLMFRIIVRINYNETSVIAVKP